MPLKCNRVITGYQSEDSTEFNYCSKNRKNVLHNLDNIKEKCNKSLKKKLKRYKLRKDGMEDPEIIDVSKNLSKSLKIKSPNQNSHCSEYVKKVESNELHMKNYLFKMETKIYNKAKPASNKNVHSRKINSDKESNNTIRVDDIPDTVSEVHENYKHVNAFDLLMNSRNKSIGSNSPGKDKSSEEFESEDIVSKKNLKQQRKNVLQKMAEAKGCLKTIEIEECKNEYIRKQMDKRKNRLKKILTRRITDKSHETFSEKQTQSAKSEKLLPKCLKVKNEKYKKEAINCNILSQCDVLSNQNNSSLLPKKDTEIKSMNEEDEIFLNKLSPSLKKKENVLCYFKKIDNNRDSIENIANKHKNERNEKTLKVKMASHYKNRLKKKNKSLVNNHLVIGNTSKPKVKAVEESNLAVEEENSNVLNSPSNKNYTKQSARKRKRKKYMENDCEVGVVKEECLENIFTTEDRPKRNIKKPIKYSDDYKISSSDDELQIFSPKRKKRDNKNSLKNNNESKVPEKEVKALVNKKRTHKPPPRENLIKNETVIVPKKLAPIFCTKTQLDPAAVEAKQKFLQSGMPDQMKKIISKQHNANVTTNSFPITKHIQQNNFISRINDEDTIEFIPFQSEQDCPLETITNFQHLLNFTCDNTVCYRTRFSNDVCKTLQNIKETYPQFPVYRTFHTMKNKYFACSEDFNEECVNSSYESVTFSKPDMPNDPKSLNWSEKYRARTTKDIIGNFEPIRELKKWLTAWKENKIIMRNKINSDSDSSDFYYSDTDSMRSNNLIIIHGPVGSGKTSSVYAVAAELAMKVIEVNASSRRTGKIMLQDLQEATQSHKVNRNKEANSDNSQNTQYLQEIIGNSNKQKKKMSRSIAKKKLKNLNKNSDGNIQSSSQNSCRRFTGMSIILIDDADIVFEQDDGFASALSQIVHCSKRPVIIVTTSLNSPHLQKYVYERNILKMNRLKPRMLGTWLDILCLADCGECCPGLGAKLLEYFRGDMRKTINSLQLLISGQSTFQGSIQGVLPLNDNGLKNFDVEDENSSMFWVHADIDNSQLESTSSSADSLSNLFNSDISSLDTIQLSDSIRNLSIWWNLPTLLNTNSNDKQASDQKEYVADAKKSLSALNVFANVIDSISLSDMITHQLKPNGKYDITSHPWFAAESDSVSDKEKIENYSSCRELGLEICHAYVKNSVSNAEKFIGQKMTHTGVSEMVLEREKEKIISRHHSLTDSFNVSAALDRRAVATDYWSTCRTICRLEKGKTNNSTKRKNRYCHYLKTMKVMCDNDSYDKLCDSLSTKCEQKGT